MAARDVLRLLVGALALAGLLAMHGLAGHGSVAVAAPAVAAQPVEHLTAGNPTPSSAHSSAHSSVEGGSDHGGQGDHAMAALCLALLVGVGMALLGLLLGAQRGGVVVRRLAWPTTWTPYHRESDPPDLDALCVLRC